MPRVTCPKGHRVKVSDADMGTFVTCDTCQTEFEAEANDGDADKDNGSDKKEKSVKTKVWENGLLYGRSISFWICSVLGKPMLFVGLLLVVLGRGCDSTGMRSVARTNAQYDQAKVSFKLKWDAESSAAKLKLTKKHEEITEWTKSKEKKDEDFKKLDKEREELEKAAMKIQTDEMSARAVIENGEWRPLREAALKAITNHQMSSYFFTWMFILGTILLVLGVLTVAFSGEGAERWVAYIIIAILVFSIYVGGAAWIDTILTSAVSSKV